jgi:hypothetical protein
MKTIHYRRIYAFIQTLGLVIGIAGSSQASGLTFTTVEFPGAEWTEVDGISGSTVIGTYFVAGAGQHGFIYNGSTFATLDFPGKTNNDHLLTGISGGTITGNYIEYNPTNGYEYYYHGFIYNGSGFTQLDVPGAQSTFIGGISGGTIVGNYYYPGEFSHESAPGHSHGFIYTGSTFTTLDYPGALTTEPRAISGRTIVGIRDGTDGYIYDGSTFAPLDVPRSSGIFPTYVTGVSGGIVDGYYEISETLPPVFAGFVYDGFRFTTLNFPGADTTWLMGVCGNTVYGRGVYYGSDDTGDLVTYGPGFVAQLQVPGLQLSFTTSNTVAISWPYPSTGWSLQQNSDLTTTNWATSTNIIANDGTNNFIIAHPTAGKMFFRLKN